MKRMRDKLAFFVLLTFFGGLGLFYSLTTPLFEAPDEVWHYAYVRYLVRERRLPPLTDPNTGAFQEVGQPPLYYLAAALVSGWAPDDDLQDLLWHNPGFGYQAGGALNDNKNMLVHTGQETRSWHGAVLAVRLARLVSLAFGLLTVVAAWGLGRAAFPAQPVMAHGVAATVAFTPQFLFISGIASNDSAAAALAAWALWAMAWAWRRGLTSRRSLGVGLLVGLAASAKTSNLLLALPALVVVGLGARGPWHQKATAWLALGAGAALTGGAWYLRNALQYGDPLGVGAHHDTPWRHATPPALAELLGELPQVFKSFWGAFGWGHVEYPTAIYLALGGLTAVGLLGWGVALIRRRLTGQRSVLCLSAAWCGLVFIALLSWMRQVGASHGRLLFPAIGAWAVLWVGGTTHVFVQRQSAGRWLLALLLGGLAALSLLTPWTVIRPAFALPRLLSPAAAATTVSPVDWTYGGAARLLGVALERDSVAPGEQLAVRACWEAVAGMEKDYTVFVQLVGRADARVAERATYPGLGRFPTSLWPVGRAFCDVYRLQVEEWAPVPELYDLLIGLYDAQTGERLAARTADGAKVSFTTPARVRVAPRQTLAVVPQHSADYVLGDAIALTGYDLSGLAHGGETLTVTLYWRADAQPPGDYTVFVHVLDETGQQLAQHDGPPRAGRYPTSAWQSGDRIPDTHVLNVPDLPAGHRLRLVAGMYDPATLDRLPVAGPLGPLPDNLIPLWNQ